MHNLLSRLLPAELMLPLTSSQPILRRKQHALDVQDLKGLLRISWKLPLLSSLSGFYSRIDQVFLLWGAIALVIFATAQFLPLDWGLQAVLWSGLTLVGSVATVHLAWCWVTVEQLRWVIYWWVALMIVGVAITNLGILGGQWSLLPHLCPLWLSVCGLGYLGTGWGLRSRAFLLCGFIHLAGIPLIVGTLQWQYLVTGLVTALPLFLLAEVQWDMHSASSYQALTEEQQRFNLQQRLLRG
jgi:hypothetical protein